MAVPCVKNHYGQTYFDEFMPTCLRGAVFSRHSVLFPHERVSKVCVILLPNECMHECIFCAQSWSDRVIIITILIIQMIKNAYVGNLWLSLHWRSLFVFKSSFNPLVLYSLSVKVMKLIKLVNANQMMVCWQCLSLCLPHRAPADLTSTDRGLTLRTCSPDHWVTYYILTDFQ